MSETPETYTAQEAEAERVLILSWAAQQRINAAPLDTEELATALAEWDDMNVVYDDWAEDWGARILATLDAARAELERKEAEAAVLRGALERLQKEQLHPYSVAITAYEALNSTTAGAALLERVRQLEGELVELRGLAPIALAAVEYVDEDGEHLVAGAWHDLEHAVQVYRTDHQGTGTAREEGE